MIHVFIHTEGSLQLCDVRIRCDFDNLEEAGGQSQRNVRVGADVGMHGANLVAPSVSYPMPYAGMCLLYQSRIRSSKIELVVLRGAKVSLKLVILLQGLAAEPHELSHTSATSQPHSSSSFPLASRLRFYILRRVYPGLITPVLKD
jgi:hypothetical protein